MQNVTQFALNIYLVSVVASEIHSNVLPLLKPFLSDFETAESYEPSAAVVLEEL